MNKNAIKTYAIWARNELIDRVSQKAYEYGIEKDNVVSPDAQSVNGRLLSDSERIRRQSLIREINNKGYDQVIEETAYTWFNRFIALRYMEVNNYLLNKVRLFTNENNEFKPQIIEEALHIELEGLDRNRVFELKEANNNEELYKELLLATCNDMHKYLPGMFKTIDDYMTLLFPNNLLREESVLGRLISDIDEDSWTDQVQIIGWLYQYYNTEPKDKTFADLKKNIKVNKDTIPAVTQLFTPDWIVRYMTENSLGRLWLDGHEDKGIKSNWKYYLDEAEQEPDVQKELDKIKAEHAKLTPDTITFLDPCMGSGHILVYAFDVFMQIYVSEGWTEKEAAVSILKNNIFGLDIDERAYQLSYFALMMKARQYNRRILSENITPNVMAIEESNTLRRDLLNRFGDLKPLATRLVDTFTDAKEYGSILNVEFTKEELKSLNLKLKELDALSAYEDLLTQTDINELIEQFTPLLKQARIMSAKYDCVVTNPPYMSLNGADLKLNSFTKGNYKDSKNDLSTVFMEKTVMLCDTAGYIAMINIPVWMFLTSYEKLRIKLLQQICLVNMVHPGRGIFGSDFGSTTFVFRKVSATNYKGEYRRLFETQVEVKTQEQREAQFLSGKGKFISNQSDFQNIPGCPIAYWVSNSVYRAYKTSDTLYSQAPTKMGLTTGDNDLFLKLWFEIEDKKINQKFYFYNKGGDFRRWYGNISYVINWENNGYDVRHFKGSTIRNDDYYFKKCISWGLITSSISSFRSTGDYCCVFGDAGPGCFPSNEWFYYTLAYLNSKPTNLFLSIMNPTINLSSGVTALLPYKQNKEKKDAVDTISIKCEQLSKSDWDSFETSWDFKRHPLVVNPKWRADQLTYNFNAKARHDEVSLISIRYERWKDECERRFSQLKSNEEELNRIFIDIYGLQDELTPEVEDKDVTVRKADLTREIKSLISYAVGCMFGRYSLDTEGLAYAGGEWDSRKYKTYIPDPDNILPITDDEYFEDDIASRFINFIKVTYGEDTLEENLKFISDALGGKGSPREVIRNYFLNDFFKDHCNIYQVTISGKRPIYWQFDSGKKNGFKALMYIHRYTPDLIARMRTSYIHELQSKYNSQISLLEGQIDSAASTSDRVKLEKQLKKIKEQADELKSYEEKVHHYADMMMPVDLDDGVKVNYAKFEELLTKIK